MSDIKALVIQNSLELPEEKKEQLLRQAQVGALSFLSPEREMGAFLLYCTGDSLEEISAKTNLPMDVLLVTAMHYKWSNKARVLKSSPKEIQKSLTNSLLIATYMAIKEELAEILAGKKKANQSNLIPSNPAQLEKLMNMVMQANNLEESGNIPQPQAPISVNAENVQINQGVPEKPQVLEENADKNSESSEEAAAKLATLGELSK